MIGLITYPNTKSATKLVFKLNSDDFNTPDIRRICALIKKKGLKYKYYRTYHASKLMSWGVFRISMNQLIDWPENKRLANIFVNEALS